MLLIDPTANRIAWTRLANRQSESAQIVWEDTPRAAGMLEALLAEKPEEAIAIVLPHGANRFQSPITRLTPDLLPQLEACLPFAPRSNAPALAAARLALQKQPATPIWILCETAWFGALPAHARRYAVPRALEEASQAYRYGGNGLTHAWLWQQVQADYPEVQRLITVLLTNTPDVCTIVAGQPIETSQGFAGLEGPLAASGSGEIDPAVALLLSSEEQLSPTEIEDLLANRSGWNSLLAQPASLPQLWHATDPAAPLAREMLLNSLLKAIGAGAAAAGGLDALLFAAPNSAEVEELARQICRRLAFLGISDQLPPPNSCTCLRFSTGAAPVACGLVSLGRTRILLETFETAEAK